MEQDKIIVHTSGNSIQSELLRQYLEDHDIKAFIINKQDSSYLFGDVEIYVYRDDVMKAKQLINKFEN